MRVIRKFKSFLLKVYWLTIVPVLLSSTVYAVDLGIEIDDGKIQYNGTPPSTIYNPSSDTSAVVGVLNDSVNICTNIVITVLGFMVAWEAYKLTWDGDKPKERAMHINNIKRIFIALAVVGGMKTLVGIAKVLLVS